MEGLWNTDCSYYVKLKVYKHLYIHSFIASPVNGRIICCRSRDLHVTPTIVFKYQGNIE